MSNLQTYLASKYMSGPKADAILSRAAPKKKKRKLANNDKPTDKPTIVDEDGGWSGSFRPQEEQDELEDVIVASDRSFKKRNDVQASKGDAGQWITIKEPTPPPAEDEQPIVVATEAKSSFRGGLVTADQLRKQRASRPAAVKEAPAEQEQETVYRDASGRKIDTKAERAEAARKKREREELEARKMEWGKGVVQKEDEERKRAELAAESMKDLARYANDTEMNERMKAEERWNDPAAAFLSKSRKSKGPRRPEYKGPPPPPNRFGIKPGYRWDGVDRSNGFEKKYFQKINERSRITTESHQWSVEDM